MIARFQRSAGDVADLRVGRLRLVAITPEMLEAEQREAWPTRCGYARPASEHCLATP